MSDLIDRQKAIEALQKEIDKGKPPFNDTMGAVRCGVRLARNIIEDLPSAQPVAKDINVPVSDCISRQAAIEEIKACDDGHGFVWLDGVRAVLTLLPSVQERKKGRWRGTNDAECNQCGHVYPLFIRWQNYCPNCGCAMTEGTEDE